MLSDLLALEDIVQATGDIGSAVDEVVCAADEVRAIDDVERAADVFVRAVDENTLADEVVLEEDNDVPVLASRDPPTDDRSQLTDDEDLERGENKVAEPTGLWKLDEDFFVANDSAPAISKTNVKPLTTTMPDAACIRCRFPGNPLETSPGSPPLFSSPPEFVSSICLSQERMNELEVLTAEIVWPGEREFIAKNFRVDEMDIAWNESEKGPPVVIAEVARETENVNEAERVNAAVYKSVRPFCKNIQATHHRFSNEDSHPALYLAAHAILTIPIVPTHARNKTSTRMTRQSFFIEVYDLFRRQGDPMSLRKSERNTNTDVCQNHVLIFRSGNFKGCKPKRQVSVKSTMDKKTIDRTGLAKRTRPEQCRDST